MVKNVKKNQGRSSGKSSLASSAGITRKRRAESTGAISADTPASFLVYGRVVDSKEAPSANLIVVAFDKDIGGENRLGESPTTANGEFRIPYAGEAFRRSNNERRGADVFVRVHDAQRSLLFTSKTFRNASRELRIDIKLPDPKFVVRGRVTGARKGMLVLAYDKDLRSEQQVGKPFELEDDGSYSIEYGAADFARAEKGAADLRISVCEPGGRELRSSEIFFNAGPDTTIDLALADSSPSERERYLRDIEPLLQGLTLRELDDKDIDFLVGDTGIDRQHIQWLIQAGNLEDDAASPPRYAANVAQRAHSIAPRVCEISAEMYYGWFRLGMPTDQSALWEKSTDELITAMKAAVDQRLIPAISGADQERIADSIKQLKLHLVLRSPAPGNKAGLGDLLETLPTPPPLDQQLALAAAVNTLRPDDPRLAEKVAAVAGFDGDAAAVARTLRLGALTARHLPLTKALQGRLQQAEEDEGTLRSLAEIRPDEWLDLAHAHGTPEGIALAPAEFAETLAAQVERQHPTTALAANLMEGRPLGQHPLLADAGGFLRDNPTFDIVTANLNALKDEAKLDSVADPENLNRGLRAVQRFNSLGASLRDTATLLANDLYAPHQLLAAGPTQLVELLDGQIAPERIIALHDQAEELHNVTFAAFTAAMSPLSGPDVLPGNPEPTSDTDERGAVGLENMVSYLKSRDGRFDPNKYKSLGPIVEERLSETTDAQYFDDVVSHQPTLQSLFGSQDACTCGHCSSVLSPAAYFVDLLQFIRKASSNEQLLQRLLHRRPDLRDIELSCSNTHTAVPSIDLAREILENAVALELSIDLPPGTTLENELRDWYPVGAAVRTALEKTVRSFAGEGQAEFVELNGDGTTDWTVTDLHRRWTLNAQPDSALIAQDEARGSREVDAEAVNVSQLIQALDGKTVARDAQAAFARLFAPNHAADYSNYQVTVTPLTPGRLWKVAYRIVAELVVDAGRNELTLRIPGSRPWSVKRYDPKTIAGVQADLENNKTPELVRLLISARFPDAGRLSVKALDSRSPIDSRGAKAWAIAAAERALTLTYSPAHLKITSLAYQSGDPRADAIAEPENHNPEAYARLKNATFPWSLPLDLPLEEVRLFLERARSSRRQLIDLMLPVDATLSARLASLANELFGLSEAEAALVSSENATPTVYDHWGIPESQDNIFDAAIGRYLRGTPPLVLLKNVSILLQQSRLSFEELQAMLATRFVTSGGTAPLHIVPGTTCKPSEMRLPELTAGHLDRLHRFIRLWRKLGWTAHELDLALQAFGGVLTAETLINLAGLERLKQELALPVATLVGGLDRLETQPWTDYLAEDAPEQLSLYATIFQREAVRKVSDYADFSLRADGAELQITPNLGIGAHAEYVGNCIGIRSSVVAEWVSADNALGVVDTLNLANLSRLYAAATLCHALGIDAEQLAHHLTLHGTNTSPFRSALTVQERVVATLEFIERFRNIAKAGVDAETLRYVLQHYEVRGSDVNLSAVQVTQLAATAREAVRSIPDSPEKTSAVAAATLIIREDAAIAALSTGLDGARELVDELLRNRIRHPSDAAKRGIDALLAPEFTTTQVAHSPTAPIPPDVSVTAALKAKVDAADTAVDDLIVRLHKSLLLCTALKLEDADLDLLRESATSAKGFTALDFNMLPVSSPTAPLVSILGFEQLLAVARLRSVAPNGGDLLRRYILPADSSAAWGPDAARQVLATGLGVAQEEVKSAADQIGLTTDEQYRDPIAVTRLIDLLVALKKLDATVKVASALTTASPDEAAATGARELLRGKYGESHWHDLIKPIEDKLRERQRNALVDYLIDRDKLRDANDLYEHYLIDVQTGSCMTTTRLLQATAAVQLFVQRVMLNLEPGASLNSDKRALWDWMHSYRVWEANRKVFLFPENWLLPELRDDKTALFREMESALSEGEPTQESMRSALLGYLDGFGELSQVSVIAMYEDRRLDGDSTDQKPLSTLYVVGRTPNQPFRYFWRSCVRFGDETEMFWNGWEPLDLDNGNDFVMPFVMGGDLHVAWPILRKTTGEPLPKKTDDQHLSTPPPLLWEVQIAWQRRTAKGWTKRKIGHDPLVTARLRAISELRSFVFRVRKDEVPLPMATRLSQDRISIDCYAAVDPANPMVYPEVESDPKEPSPSTTPQGGYNVPLTLLGQVWEKYKLTANDSEYLFRPAETITVVARWYHKKDDSNLEPYSSTGYVDSNGNLSFPQGVLNRFGNLANPQASAFLISPGVANGQDVTLTYYRNAQELKKLTGNIGPWAFTTWAPTLVFEIPRPANYPFGPDRPVTCGVASGTFVFTAARDMEVVCPALPPPATPQLTQPAGLQRLGNRFAQQSGGKNLTLPNSSTLVVDRDLVAPIVISPSTVASSSATLATKPAPWHVRDKYGQFFVYSTGSDWRVLPDGQDFVGAYRSIAAVSTVALLDRQAQELRRDDAVTAPVGTPASSLSTTSQAISFVRSTPYANYNWELFLHAPLVIADFLASQQRFEVARRWLHTVFDPTTDKTTDGIPQFWRFLPFHNDSQPDAIAKLLTWLADPLSGDPDIEEKLTSQISEWRKNPFMPHLIARLRPSAYQWHTFFAYLTILIGWGDQLFRRDTRESVNEATLLYVLAAKLLGPRPRTIRGPSPLLPQTYRTLSAGDIDEFSNAWIVYADLPGIRRILAAARAAGNGSSQQPSSRAHVEKHANYQNTQKTGIQLLTSFGLAFCIPQNEKLTEFYDLIEKRLFDVRHCRNIDGVFRELPLYDPPIDPLLLIRARAAGLDIATVIAELYAPLPNYRFNFTLQKALEFCAEVKSLGGALLSALEKQDTEELTLLRSTHEIAMLKLARDVKKKQVDEADANIVALQQSQVTATERFGQYQKLLGKTSITRGQDGLPVVEQSSSLTVSTDPVGAASGLGLSRMEVDQLQHSAKAHVQTQIAGSIQIVAGVVSLIPNIFAGTPFAGQTSGGTNFGIAANAVAKAIEMLAAESNYLASQAGIFGGYERRQDEWVHQSRLALAELKQLDKQVLAAQIRKSIAENELDNHDQQMANASEVDDFMRSKFTNQQLFRWMSSQISEVYFRTYQLALDQARRAERTYRHELGLDDGTTPFVQPGNWDSLKRGLLAGERLHHDLKRMENAFLERNIREYELTKHVSLLQLDPIALITLRAARSCDFEIPEALFDLDCPGHYMRRIKSVSLSIPCVAGPYASVNATLQLTKNRTRIRTTGATYPRLPESQDDSRFATVLAPTMAIVTSSSQQDSGMFEPNLRDERYLPFEGAGVISTWHLELPDQFHQFDYDTISDVILHIRYTARDGGEGLKGMATAYLGERVGRAEAAGMVRLFSIRHEFPSAWAKFIATKIDGNAIKTAVLSLDLRSEHYPFWSQGRLKSVEAATVIARVGDDIDDIEIVENANGTGKSDALEVPADERLAGLLMGPLTELAPKGPVTEPNKPLEFYFKQNSVTDLWLAIAWKGSV